MKDLFSSLGKIAGKMNDLYVIPQELAAIHLLISVKEKADYEIENNLKYVSLEEIQEAALELWNQLKPTFTT